MSPKLRTLLGLICGIALTLAVTAFQPHLPAAPALAADTTCDSNRAINVSGSAVINVQPDQVTIQLGVMSNDSTPDGVHSKNTAAIKRVIAAIKALGVADKDISTDYYIIRPLYNNYDSLTITGYRINNIVAVKLKDVSKVSAVLASALEAGANEVVDVDFQTTQLRRFRDEARALAMKAAQEKAQALTSVVGTQPGCVLNIDESTGASYYGGWWGGRYQPQVQNVMQNAPSGDQPSADDGPISLGQIAVKAEVNVRFSLR
ncbi:MAG: SIMPL domain-containing protein [Chloroflexi bacterium]|nr:SIMPL domain-containing protein [Chloroflexota bacterium]